MPGDPNDCRENAKRCLKLASETTNPRLKESLIDVAERWAALARDLETTRVLLAEVGAISSGKPARPKNAR
jgi:hypothetical protein